MGLNDLPTIGHAATVTGVGREFRFGKSLKEQILTTIVK